MNKLVKPFLLVISIFFMSFQTDKSILRAFEKDGNIFLEYSDRTSKQLTFSKSDKNPIILKKQNSVVFTRLTHDPVDNEAKKLVKVNYTTLFEKTITDKKTFKDAFKDGNESTSNIINIGEPQISEDEKYIYFITENAITSDVLVKVDLNTGVWYKLFGADTYELITKGSYKNLFLIGRSEIKERGRDIYYYLVNEKNVIEKEFDTKENYLDFRKSINN